MVLSKDELLVAIDRNVQDLQQSLDMHRCLVASMVGKDVDTRNLQRFSEICPERSSEKVLKSALKETIEILEESRKSFKSKRLEALRKKLINVLAEV